MTVGKNEEEHTMSLVPFQDLVQIWQAWRAGASADAVEMGILTAAKDSDQWRGNMLVCSMCVFERCYHVL